MGATNATVFVIDDAIEPVFTFDDVSFRDYCILHGWARQVGNNITFYGGPQLSADFAREVGEPHLIDPRGW